MKAVVKKIELNKTRDKDYFKIIMVSQEKEYILDNPLINDSVNFRKQIFGILTACNCYDLMKLASKNPILQKAKGYYFEGKGYKIFENKNKEWFLFDEKIGMYLCQKEDKHIKKLIKMLQKHNLSTVTIEEGCIKSILSGSGTFNILFQSKNLGVAYMTSGQVYFGFGNPINIGNNVSEDEKLKSAEMFKSFIVSLMKFFNQDDLLKLGGQIERYPEVEISLNHNNVVNSITNPITGLGLRIGNNYEIIDSNKILQDDDRSC